MKTYILDVFMSIVLYELVGQP